MKLFLTFCVFFVIFPVSAQNKTCFKTLTELKQIASGYWKIEDETSTQLYRISFNTHNKPLLEILESLDVKEDRPGSKYDLAFRDKEVLSIEYFKGCYNLGVEIKAKFGSEFYELKFLDKTTYVFKTKRFVRTSF